MLPLYFCEPAKSKKSKMELFQRNSFKGFTSLKKGLNTSLINDLTEYSLDQRIMYVQATSELKWLERVNREGIDRLQIKTPKIEKPFNLCIFQPIITIICKQASAPNVKKRKRALEKSAPY